MKIYNFKNITANSIFKISSISMLFVYSNYGGIRIVPILIYFFCFIGMLMSSSIIKSIHLSFVMVITCIVFLQSLYSGAYDFLLGMLLFFIYSYWPLIINLKSFNMQSVVIRKTLILLSLLLAMGVFFQILILMIFGVSFGTHDIKEGQLGFAFLWRDWSYLSVVIVAPILLVKDAYGKSIQSAIIIFALIAGSVLTSARSGLFSLIIYLGVIVLLNSLRILNLKGGINLRSIKNILYVIVVVPLLFLFWDAIQVREINISDDSGRYQTYIDALLFLQSNYLSGINFNMSNYLMFHDFAPHNIFLNLFLNGGLIFFIIFIFWFAFVLADVFKYGKKFNSYFFITLIGLQFVPSLFAAYSLALYISLIVLLKFGGPQVRNSLDLHSFSRFEKVSRS